ncbi:Sodium-dependent dicarboxylate transporter SdcS [Crateriforma conspicua]|uniref:Sodium-dependent dicarboxylate transporter SdcS n=1 Tax=Crateriforma conspicua TaxID=2527996 RepID=A0A5C6FVU0_9PLAN|nr:Sodium-dependent dicarboxylate transporter SdcS [Crateriforma conspicua]
MIRSGHLQSKLSSLFLPAAPVLAFLVGAACYWNGLSFPASVCAAVAIICALWWIFECLHIAVVGLVPFVVFPLAGVVSHKSVAAAYGDTMILLLMGGFFLSAAMERSGAHRRIALEMVRLVGGTGGRRLVLGFMLATASLSMWISNSATSLMMLPIALAILDRANDPTLEKPLLLGMAYAASVGGMATPIGTPPNVIFMGVLASTFDRQMTFLGWMMYGIPIVAVLIPLIWWWVTRKVSQTGRITMPEVGSWRPSEIRVMVIFAIAATLWIFRKGPYGGWSAWMPGGDSIGDATVALAASLAMFICPAGETLKSFDNNDAPATGNVPASHRDDKTQTSRLLDWDTAAQIPWGILVMFGGGLALAKGFEQSGLSETIGQQLTFIADAPLWVVVLTVCLLVSFMTEMTSSTATATLLLPILAAMAIQTGIRPESIMVPGTISASCAFMLPVATAPNTIIFSSGKIRTDEMARTGLFLNLAAAVVITVVSYQMSAFGF